MIIVRDHNAVLAFNQQHMTGCRVRFWTGLREGEGRTGHTWTEAQLLGGHIPVVYIRDDEGRNVGCVCLSHVEALETAAPAPRL